jgi:hypothetical protein
MESHPSVTETDRPVRIPPAAWFLGLGLIAALVAIFVFNASVSNVVYYGFLTLMIGSHFFMHGSHAGHGGSQSHQHGAVSNNSESDKPDENQHSGHTGGCH